MHRNALFTKLLTLFIVITFIVGMLPQQTASAQTYTVKAPYVGIWLTAQELAALPTSGTAWTALVKAANASAGTPQISDQDSNNDVYVLAKALVYARTGQAAYRTQVVDQLKRAMNTEAGGRTLALGRNLVSYVIAADLINLPADAALDQTFRAWLRKTLTENLDGRTLVSTHEERPNNWGTHAGASRAAVAFYLGDRAELDRTAKVFAGWLGNRTSYASFKYGELDWQCNPSAPVGINPKGCTKNGRNIDGAQPEEMRRGGSFTWPPTPTGYAWEALQGGIVQAYILKRAGYPVFDWADKALLRAYQFVYSIGWKDEGDDRWQVWLLNQAYGTNYPTTTAGHGKNMGWTDWTHGAKSSAPAPTVPTAQPTQPPAQPTQPPAQPTPTTPPTQPTAQPTIPPVTNPNPSQPPAQGSLIKAITFESGKLIDANTGADRAKGSVTVTNGGLSGTYSATIANAKDAYLQEDFTAAGNVSVTFLLYLNALPSSDSRIMLISNGGTSVGNLLLRSNGTLRLRNGSSTIGSDSPKLEAKRLYMVRIIQKAGSGSNAVLGAFVAPAGGQFGAPFASMTNGTWKTAATFVRFGATASGAINARFDDIRIEQVQ